MERELADENRCGALLVVDNEPIRKAVELELQTVREAIEEYERKIERHENLDLPAFRQSIATECVDLLREQRLLEEKLAVLRGRLAAIQGLTQHGISNVGAAFFWFSEIEQESGAVPPYVRRAWEEVTVGRTEPHSRRHGSHFRDKGHGAEAGKFDEERTGEVEEEPEADADVGEDRAARDDEGSEGSRQQEEGIVGKKVKSLFRKIALILHPDRAGVVSRQELQLWYYAQKAYEETDVAALETILARCDHVGTNSKTLSELREFVRQAGVRFLILSQSIAGLQQLPSWEFLLLSNAEQKVRLRRVRGELSGAIRELARDVALTERALKKMAAKAERWVERRRQADRQLALRF